MGMKVLPIALSVILLGSILLSACGAVTPVSTATPTFTPTSLPTRTHTPTPLQFPSPTATLSRADGIFVIPTMNVYPDTTPTPIATPVSDSSSVRLRDLSDDDFLNFIGQLQERSYQNFPPHWEWWTEGQFISSQEPVALTIQEYLYHYPDSPEANRLRWQLAFIDSIGFVRGNDYYDEWIVKQLQNMLNQGDVLPENLETILDPYWFDVDYYQPVNNLFGDGTRAWFYVIKPQVWQEEENNPKTPDYFDRGGLFVVIHEASQGVFQLHILENAWSFSNGSSSLFEISDFNQNGFPEIALNIWFHSGSMCGGNFKIFEWRDGDFVDLTKGDIRISDCIDNYEYSLANNVPSIVFNRFLQPVPSVYTWNGTYYELSGYQYSDLVEKWKSARSFTEESDAIEEILASENLSNLSDAQIDFLRYRLGILYALESEIEKSRQVLQELIEKPLDETRTIYSDFATYFLKYYSGDKTLYIACQKSREIFEQKSSSSSQDDEELYGITFDFSSGFGPGLLRCFSGDVFEMLINKIPVSVENVPEELRRNNVNLYYAEKQDVNLDGLSDEWVIIIDDGIFVVFPDKQYYKTMELDYFWYGEDSSKYLRTTVNIARWNGVQKPILTVLTDQEFSMMNIGENYESTWLDTESDVANVLFMPQSTPSQYQVFHIKPPSSGDDYFGPPWEGFRWDASRQEFRDDLLEYNLFIEHDPNKAVEIAQTILPLLSDGMDIYADAYWFPRYYYLCGLSYELSGDTQKATEIYWQLWHDFPESPYALMAQYKLEPVKP
jgi:tetratricopeptide (TPR) repeat protein